MPLAFYLDFATKQEGLRRFIDSKGLLSPRIGSLSCRPLPPSDNKGKDLAVIKQILHSYSIEYTNLESPVDSGGDFFEGALQGLNIGFLNHGIHGDGKGQNPRKILVKTTESGTYEIVVIGAGKNVRNNSSATIASGVNTVRNVAGSSMKGHGGNSTVGDNYIAYWHSAGERGFYGNQYVSTVKLTQIGKGISKVTGPIGKVIDGVEIYKGSLVSG